ncbi:MAG: hypothetical protein QOH86_595 [Sphingomonadales bacterium]|nr:hypothetical protein [Sphingomonadales bacterium]
MAKSKPGSASLARRAPKPSGGRSKEAGGTHPNPTGKAAGAREAVAAQDEARRTVVAAHRAAADAMAAAEEAVTKTVAAVAAALAG